MPDEPIQNESSEQAEDRTLDWAKRRRDSMLTPSEIERLRESLKAGVEHLCKLREQDENKKPKVRPIRRITDLEVNKQCQVHGAILEPMRVRVIYGSPIHDEAFKDLIKARAALFPNTKSHVLGGCELGSIGPDYEVLVCRQCRVAEREWAQSTGLPTEPRIGGLFIPK